MRIRRETPQAAGDFGAAPPREKRPPWALLLIVLLSLTARCLYYRTAPPEAPLTSIDARGYDMLASNLLDGHGFSMKGEAPYLPETVRTPLYPAFVASTYFIIGRHPEAVIFAQILLDGLTVLLLYHLTRMLAGRRAGLAAALLYALTPGQWRFTTELMTEMLLVFLLTLTLCLFVRYLRRPRRWLAVLLGLVMGLSILCKPNVQYLPLILVVGLAIHFRRQPRRLAESVAIVLGVTMLVLAPWLVRNHRHFGRWFLSTAFDVNLGRVSAVATLASVRGQSIAPWTEQWEAIYGEILEETARRYGWPPDPFPRDSAQVQDQRYREVAAVSRDIIRAHPVHFVSSHLSAVARSLIPSEHRFWYEHLTGVRWEELGLAGGVTGGAGTAIARGHLGTGLRILWQERVAKPPLLASVLWAGWLLAYGLSFVLLGLGLYRLRHRPAVAFVFAATLLYVVAIPGPISHVRFRVPVMPLILALAVVGLWGTGAANPPGGVGGVPLSDLTGL